ncbi:TRAP transporter large permease subunit [Chloroflexota bacterium]
MLVPAIFALLLVGLLSGFPVAFFFASFGLFLGLSFWGPHSVHILVQSFFNTMNSWLLVAIPLFVFMAAILERSGVAESLFSSLHKLFGRARGGLGIVIVIMCVMLGACTGVIGATLLTAALIGLPNLLKQGYDKDLSCGIVAAGGCLGTIVPPSIMLVVMGQVVGLSVGKLFMGALFPGLLLASLYIVYIVIKSMLQPASVGYASPVESGRREPLTVRLVLSAAGGIIPPAFLIVAVLGSIYGGLATATEAAGVGALFAVLLSIAYKRFGMRMLHDACSDTAFTTSMTLMIIASVTVFTTVFVGIGGQDVAQAFLLTLGIGKWGLFSLMCLIIFVLGMFMDWPPIVLLTFPIFLPVVGELGIDQLWFVIAIAVLLQTSYMTPPFGFALFMLRGVAPEGVAMENVYRGIIPFLVLIAVAVVLLALFPQIITWLPNTMIR